MVVDHPGDNQSLGAQHVIVMDSPKNNVLAQRLLKVRKTFLATRLLSAMLEILSPSVRFNIGECPAKIARQRLNDACLSSGIEAHIIEAHAYLRAHPSLNSALNIKPPRQSVIAQYRPGARWEGIISQEGLLRSIERSKFVIKVCLFFCGVRVRTDPEAYWTCLDRKVDPANAKYSDDDNAETYGDQRVSSTSPSEVAESIVADSV